MGHIGQKLRNFSLLSAEQVVRLAIGVAVMTLIARKLGPAGFAAYTYVFAVFGIAVPLARFGTNVIVVRELAASRDTTSQVLGTSLAVSAAVTVAAGLIAVCSFALAGAPPGIDWRLVACGVLFLAATPGEVFFNYARAIERFGKLVALRIAIAVAGATLTIHYALGDGGLLEFAALRGGETVVLAAASYLGFLLSGAGHRHLRYDRGEADRMLRAGFPIALAGLASMVLMRIDQVMLGHMAGASELGLYGVAVRVAEVATVVPVMLYSTLYPAIVRNFGRDPAAFDHYAQRVFDAFWLAGLAVTVGMAGASWLALVPVFGASFAPALPLTLWLLAAMPFLFLHTAMTAILTARGWMWTAPALAGSAAIFNVAINFWLIPGYGALGAALATALTYLLLAVVFPFAVPAMRPSACAALRSLDPFGAGRRVYDGLVAGAYTRN